MPLSPKFVKPATCADCVLERTGAGYAPVDGPKGARVTFIAEALGGDEVVVGKPLQGMAGGGHTRILTRAGLSRDLTRADNCVRCMPPGMWFDEKAPWYFPALSHCRQYLQQTLNDVPDNGVVVTLGAVALRSILNLHGQDGISVNTFHHTVNRDPTDRFWVVPTFHTAHLMRGAMNLLEVVTSAYRLADRVGRQGFRRTPTTLVVDPSTEWADRWVAEHLRRVESDPDGTHLSLDTEFDNKGDDEGEIDIAATAKSPLTRINVGNDATTGVSWPYHGEYIRVTEKLLRGVAELRGLCWAWNKYADWDHLQAAGHTLSGIECYDGMWLWHYLQSDLPRGLGFVAPLASDFGPWKHWSKVVELEGKYAAADAVQNYRTCMWVLKAAIDAGLWDVFRTDWHERDAYVLRPSRAMGVPADRQALEAFHGELQTKLARKLTDLKAIEAAGTLRPKNGYAKKPVLGTCGHCDGLGGGAPRREPDGTIVHVQTTEVHCTVCGGTGEIVTPPPKSILGQQKGKRKSEAKQAYVAEEIKLVERQVEVEIRVCVACKAEDVGPKHRCPKPKAIPRRSKSDRVVPINDFIQSDNTRTSVLESRRVLQQRWFWQLPFNPSSWQQVLSYIESRGHEPGRHRKTRNPTTDKESLKKLAASTGDPLYQLLLDIRAVEKVDSTYAVGCLARLDHDDRLHPEVTPKPSTLRDSSVGPNLQNVVADKTGGDSLAAGFRKCIKARDGVPPGVTEADLDRWRTRWALTP